jgi:peptidoglycan/xylan/chitin deacetylase (PgdA/CDA1 family)
MGTFTAMSRIKAWARRGAAEVYWRAPGCLDGLRGKVTILTYHRVLPLVDVDKHCVQAGMYVSPDVFERHLGFLTAQFQLLTFSELLSLWETRRWDAEARYCVITFDDGWLDTYQHAWPILKRHRAPATVFLPTSYIGTDRWFWPDRLGVVMRNHVQEDVSVRQVRARRLQREFPWLAPAAAALEQGDTDTVIECCKKQSQDQIDICLDQWTEDLQICFPTRRMLMNWDETREMCSAGVEFGSHSVSHRILTSLSQADLTEEAEESLAMLQQQKLQPIPVFCYPNGDWSPLVAESVQAAGYRAATTTEFGYESAQPALWFGLKRINMHQAVTCNESLLAFHLAGFNDLPNSITATVRSPGVR